MPLRAQEAVGGQRPEEETHGSVRPPPLRNLQRQPLFPQNNHASIAETATKAWSGGPYRPDWCLFVAVHATESRESENMRRVRCSSCNRASSSAAPRRPKRTTWKAARGRHIGTPAA